ncbi:membrane protein [Actinomadura cremea]|nr:membrane protein [Actinomadura cremea]
MSTAETDPGGHGFAAEVRDAVTPRAVALVVGVFVLQLGFILSYIGAFHSPSLHRLPVAVAAPPQVAGPVARQLDGLPGDPVDARTARSEQDARRLLLHREVTAAIVIDPRGATDTLLIASAAGPAAADAAANLAERLESARGRDVRVTDIRPPGPKDARGLSSFYLAIGWMVGGYLAASILGLAGARSPNPPRIVIRLCALAAYAVASGAGGAWIAGPLLGALDGHFLRLWGIGTLTVFAAAAFTAALQVLFGLVGIGVAILLFVVLGNPSAGGAYSMSLLPEFWRVIGDRLPTGAATTLIRDTVYFTGYGTARAWWVLAGYAAAGIVIALAASMARFGRGARTGGADRA